MKFWQFAVHIRVFWRPGKNRRKIYPTDMKGANFFLFPDKNREKLPVENWGCVFAFCPKSTQRYMDGSYMVGDNSNRTDKTVQTEPI